MLLDFKKQHKKLDHVNPIMTASWDPERLLDVRGRAMFRGGIQCHGANGGKGPRCRWTKGGRDDERSDVRDAENLLESMARKLPSNVTTQELHRLAQLCLCRDHHMNQTQMYRVANTWAELVRNTMPVTQSPPQATRSPPQVANLNPAPVTVPVTVPVTAPTTAQQFIGTEWLNTNWQAVLLAQVSSMVNSQDSQSTNGTQHQHADAPAGFASSRRSPSRERTETELATTLARLSDLQIQNGDLREKERRLEALGLEYSTFRENMEGELATTRTQLSSLQLENENLRNQEHHLKALEEHTRVELAATQEQLSTLKLENKTLGERADHLQALESEYSTFKEHADNKLSQSLAEKEKLEKEKEKLKKEKEMLKEEKEKLEGEEERFKGEEEKLKEEKEKLREEKEKLRKEKDRELETLRTQHGALEQKERKLAYTVREKDEELQTLRKQYDELERKKRELDLSTEQNDAKLREVMEENARLQYALKLAEARALQHQAGLTVAVRSGSRREEKPPRPWVRRVHGWLKRLSHHRS